MWFRLVSLSLLIVTTSSCKDVFVGNLSGTKNQSLSESGNVDIDFGAGTIVAMHQPYDLSEMLSGPTESELIARIKTIDPKFSAEGMQSVVLPHGERVLIGRFEGQSIPLVSLYENRLYEWWLHSVMYQGKAEGEVVLNRQNWVVRVPQEGDPDHPENPWYAVYETQNKTPHLVPLVEHGLNLPTRLGNQFYGERFEQLFRFVSLGEGQWQLDGRFDSPFLCSGSVIWKGADDRLFSATREFGATSYRQWRAEGPSMRLMGDIKAPSQAMKQIGSKAKDCPTRGSESLAKLIESLQYSPESLFRKPAQAVKDAHNAYAGPGSTIVINDTTWLVLSVAKRRQRKDDDGTLNDRTVYDYIVTNQGRTWPEDLGKQYSRVYQWRGETGDQEEGLEFLGSTQEFLLQSPSKIAEFSKKRLAAPGAIEALQQKAHEQLDLAEKKFSEVNSPTKIGIVVAAAYVNELVFKPLPDGGSGSFMGLKTLVPKASQNGLEAFERASLAAALRRQSDFKQRALAAFYLTGIQSVTMSADTVTANMGKKSWHEIGKSVLKTAGQTALSNGLLTLSPIVKVKEGVETLNAMGVMAASSSGLVMRWRKMSVEAAKGIDNGGSWQKALNLAAGSVTQVVSGIAAVMFKNAGLNNAIASGGVLMSEIISGRSSPGLIIGQSLEISAGLVVKNPLLRPLAITGSKLMNAFAQFQGAIATAKMVEKELDEAIALKFRQLALADAMLFLLKKRPDIIQDFPPHDRNLVLAAVADPEGAFVDGVLNK